MLRDRGEEVPLLLSKQDKGKEREGRAFKRVFQILVAGQFPDGPVEDQVELVEHHSIQVAGSGFHPAGGFLELPERRRAYMGRGQLDRQNLQHHSDLVNLAEILRAQFGDERPSFVCQLANESLVFKLL